MTADGSASVEPNRQRPVNSAAAPRGALAEQVRAALAGWSDGVWEAAAAAPQAGPGEGTIFSLRPRQASRKGPAPGAEQEAFARSVRQGLAQPRPSLDCRFLYDARGSALYEEITRQPEYYPTRTELGLLRRHAPEIAAATGPVTVVELGAGSAEKTRVLLAAYCDRCADEGRGRAAAAARPAVRFVPVDVSQSALVEGVTAVAAQMPKVPVAGVVGTYEAAYWLLPALAPVLVAFLGSTLGNAGPEQTRAFVASLARALPAGGFFLLGVDLVKPESVLRAAYNDAAGVTAAFTCNLFARMNRELGTRIDLESVRHEAVWNPEAEQIEIFARFTRDARIESDRIGRSFHFRAGDRILVEISRKFRLNPLWELLGECGFEPLTAHRDSRFPYALLLARRRRLSVGGGERRTDDAGRRGSFGRPALQSPRKELP